MTQPERIPVVTAFVHSGHRIALIRRSREVRTYQGHWAAFSGYLERLALNQARQELYEEAGLSEFDAALSGIGVPLEVDDPANGHRWLVLPFLFRLRDGAEIKTDWEAEEFGWFTREEMRELATVPGLDAALSRVWPPIGDREFWAELAGVATDTVNGATELARRGLTALGGYVQTHYEDLNRNELLQAVRAFAASRVVMGVFPNLAARLLLATELTGGQFDFDTLITESLSAMEDAVRLSAEAAAESLCGKRRLFTLSYSVAVRDAILAWHTDESEVIVAESGPRNEGLLLVDYLAERGVNVSPVADTDIASAVELADAVIVGCDAITETDDLLNKTGTRSAVEAAVSAGVPAYAVAQTTKIVPPGWPVFLERQSPADCGIGEETTGSPVYDCTPLDAFEAVFTEDGVLTPGRLADVRADLGSVELVPGS